MPEKMDRCVEKVKKDGHSEESAWAICAESVLKTILEIDVTKAASASEAKRVSGGVEYRGTKYPGFNKPTKSNREGKKKMVLAKKGDKIKVVHYGDTNYKHNYSSDAKRNFRARHNCSEKTDKFSAAYWACKDLWPTGSTKKSFDLPIEINEDNIRPHGEAKEMIVVLSVPLNIANQIEMPGSTKACDMHITLAYLECEGNEELVLNLARETLAYVASETLSPLHLKISGTGRFFHEGDDVFYATVDGIGLAEFRTHLIHHLRMNSVSISYEHDFLPHITIGYIPEDKESPDIDVMYKNPGGLDWFASCVEIWHNNYRYKFLFN